MITCAVEVSVRRIDDGYVWASGWTSRCKRPTPHAFVGRPALESEILGD